MSAFGTKFASDFGICGIYVYDGVSWNWIAGNPESMTSWGNRLVANFGSQGLYVYDGTNWNWIAGTAENIAGF